MMKRLHQSGLLKALAACVLLAGVFSANMANAGYPDKPIKWIVPAAPGGAADSAVRIVVDELSKRLGQPVVVDNRPGASGAIGLDAIAKAAPDGYTIGTANLSNFVMHPLVRAKLPFDIERDFQPVAKLTNQPNVLGVSTALSANNLKELIAYAKANPNKLAFGSSGPGSSLHIATELFKSMADIDMIHVPYRSTPAANTDLISNNIQLMIDNLSTMAPHVKSGKVRALAVTSTRRSPVLPNVPTMAEAGLAGYEMTVWGGVVAPAKVPNEIVARLNKEINAILNTPAVQQRLGELGFSVAPMTPAQFGELIKKERVKWGDVVRRADIKPE